MTKRKRLDVLLVERGLAESRAQAQALVLAGLVPGHDKPGEQVAEDAELEVERPPRFVSRGGEKLQNALDAFDVDVAGRDCADVGASTGGFTDCLLQAGAARVVAIDVGYGQLHPRLRSDPRVTVLERVNARVAHRAAVRARARRLRRLVHLASRRRCRRCCARRARLGGARAREAAVRGGTRRRGEGRRARPGSAAKGDRSASSTPRAAGMRSRSAS